MTWRSAHARGCLRNLENYPNGNWRLDSNCPRCQALQLMIERVAEINNRAEEVA
jgi:hypothetical protein